MIIAVASDERTALTDAVLAALEARGYQVRALGPLAGQDQAWPIAAQGLAEMVASGEAREGVLFCWTGTGASIAANKVPGIRAALCGDPETARGARWWNDANVLVLSLRATSIPVALEILDAWFAEALRPGEEPQIEALRAIEAKYGREEGPQLSPKGSTGRPPV